MDLDKNNGAIIVRDQKLFESLLRPERLEQIGILLPGQQVHVLARVQFAQAGCFYLIVNGTEVFGWIKNVSVLIPQGDRLVMARLPE